MSENKKTLLCLYTYSGSKDPLHKKWLDKVSDIRTQKVFTVQTGFNSKTYIEEQNFFIAVPDGYEKLSEKSMEMLKYFYYHTNYEYLIKVDDDVNLKDPEETFNKLKKYDYDGAWRCHDLKTYLSVMNWKEELFRSNQEDFKVKRETLKITLNFTALYFVLGPLYCLSRKAVAAVLEFYEKNPMHSYIQHAEDMMIGLAIEHQYGKFKLHLPIKYSEDLPRDTIKILEIEPLVKKSFFTLNCGVKRILRNLLRALRKRTQLIFWRFF